MHACLSRIRTQPTEPGVVSLMVCLTFLLASGSRPASAAILVNSPLPITHKVTVQPIIVSNDDGSDTAEYMGNAAQTSAIQMNVDLIWAQAGIDVQWLAPNFWNNTFANVGNLPPTQPRPTFELGQIVASGSINGVDSSDPLTLNMYFVEISPGFPDQSELTASGLAQFGNRGSTLRIGDDLPSALFSGVPLGQQLAGKTIAHEIGHNLGLLHTLEAENLMLATPGTLPNFNGRLNTSQMNTVFSSPFVVAVPEPASTGSGLILVAMLGWRRSRRRRAIRAKTSSGVGSDLDSHNM